MTPVRIGIMAGMVGMFMFFLYHWFFVAPVVAVLLEGVLWAIGGGALVGWAFQRTVLDQGRSGARWGLAFGALFASTLVPYELVGLLWGPFETKANAGDILMALPLAFLGVPVAIGIAWWLGGGRRILWSFVAAVTVVHFMIGGSIANFGGRGTTALIFWGFGMLEVLAGWVLGVLSRPGHASMAATNTGDRPPTARTRT